MFALNTGISIIHGKKKKKKKKKKKTKQTPLILEERQKSPFDKNGLNIESHADKVLFDQVHNHYHDSLFVFIELPPANCIINRISRKMLSLSLSLSLTRSGTNRTWVSLSLFLSLSL